MSARLLLPRRRLLQMGAASAGGLLLSGCDRLNESERFRSALRGAEHLNQASQRLLADRTALAREFSASDLSPVFKANGNISPQSPEYLAHVASDFANWRQLYHGSG